MGLIVFAALPLVTRGQRHIAVRAFAGLLRGPALRLQHAFVLGVTAAGFSFIAYLLFLQGETLAAEGIRTSYLEIPEAPFVFVFAVFVGVAALAAGALLYDFLTKRGRSEEAVRPEASIDA